MTGQVWSAYDEVDRAGITRVRTTMPGWRVDRVYADGTVGDYREDGTRSAVCLRQFGLNRLWVSAVRHDANCRCGYRIVRDVYTLLQYIRIQGRSAESNLAYGTRGKGPVQAFVLTRVLGTGAVARITDPTDPPGTVRVAATQLAEVYVPRSYYSEPVPEGLARKIRDKYGVKVRRLPRDLYSFPGSPDTVAPKNWPECMAPTEWHESGYYGLHGAAGAMLSAVIDGERKFLLVKRASSTPSQPGLWQLPGGALEADETPLEAAQRETMEEIAIPDLGGGSVVGEVVYAHHSGWKYTNYAVSLEVTPQHRVDRREIASAAWFTEEELLGPGGSVQMLPELAENLPQILALFHPHPNPKQKKKPKGTNHG